MRAADRAEHVPQVVVQGYHEPLLLGQASRHDVRLEERPRQVEGVHVEAAQQ